MIFAFEDKNVGRLVAPHTRTMITLQRKPWRTIGNHRIAEEVLAKYLWKVGVFAALYPPKNGPKNKNEKVNLRTVKIITGFF